MKSLVVPTMVVGCRCRQISRSPPPVPSVGHIYSAIAESAPGISLLNRETDAILWIAPREFLQLIRSGEVGEPMRMIVLLKYSAENPV